MKKILLSFFITFLCLISSVFADQFCTTYDTKITQMHSINGNDALYPGMPKRLTAAEFTALPKKWDSYCPPCKLSDKSACAGVPCAESNLMPGSVYQGIQANGDPWMKLAAQEGLKSVQNGGGPFGAVILQIDDASGKIIRYWVNHNHVAEWNDPTAHAEVTAIRAAAQELGVVDLGHIDQQQAKLPQPGKWSHCVLYTSVEPCPMCLSAMYWAGIKDMAFAATRFDAEVKGIKFLDNMIYEEIARPYVNRQHMHVVHANIDNSLDAFNYYKRNPVAHYGAVNN